MLYGAVGVRRIVSILFHRFGSHCANHQIRVILISSVVITSLFYPALALYWTSKPLSHFSSRWHDSLFGGAGGSLSPGSHSKLVDDIKDLWTGLDNLVVVDDSLTRPLCAKGATVRLERVIIHQEVPPATGALEQETFLRAKNIQHDIGTLLHGPSLACISNGEDGCLMLSPLQFWHTRDGNTSTLLDDINKRHAKVAGVSISPDMTLSGRALFTSSVTYARFLVLTYLFADDDCAGNAKHNEWLHSLDGLNKLNNILTQHSTEPATIVALQYNSSHFSRFPMLSTFLFSAYIISFFYFSGSLRKMDTVHSRLGLAFTGLVEIIVSTITSFSVCAIVGFQPRTVPLSILPIIIVFVGAENMFILVDAVVKTPVSLPVRERIAVGLSKAGTSNTFKVVTYNAILGSIAALSSGPIREFCAFATVVLCAHWFLIHSFFLAVLSIDIQRLELSELLSQDPSRRPTVPSNGETTTRDPSVEHGAVDRLRDMLHGRPAKNISLVMLLAFTAFLYYVSLPPVPTTNPESNMQPPLQPRTAIVDSPAWQLWSTLNPRNNNVLHVRVEGPTVITLLSDSAHFLAPISSYRLRAYIARLEPLWLVVKIFVLPIAITTGLLYLLLLYLLKNKELLNRQHSLANSIPDVVAKAPLEPDVSFLALPRANATDFRLVCLDWYCNVAVTVSVDDELVVWRNKDGSFEPTPVEQDELEHSISIRCVSLHSAGTIAAVGYDTGDVVMAQLIFGAKEPFRIFWSTNFGSPINDVCLYELGLSTNATPPPRASLMTKSLLLVSLQDGRVLCGPTDSIGEEDFTEIVPVDPSTYFVEFKRSPGDSETWVAFYKEGGTIQLYRYLNDTWASCAQLHAGNTADDVTAFQILRTGFDRSAAWMGATTTRAGVVVLWDLLKGEAIHILEDCLGSVAGLRLTSIPAKHCFKCGNMKPDLIVLLLSVGDECFMYHVRVEAEENIATCTCTPITSVPVMEASIAGRRSRSGSFTGLRTPRQKSLTMLSTQVDSLAPFPVSGHGAHSRRSSEKENGRLSLETLLGSDTDPRSNEMLKVPAAPSLNNPLQRTPICCKMAVILVPRGQWEVHKTRLLGFRRRQLPSRLGGIPEDGLTSNNDQVAFSLLPTSVLERWEIFTLDLANLDGFSFDLNSSAMKISDLRSLTIREPAEHKSSDVGRYPRLPFTRVACLAVGQGCCLAGMGNTLGMMRLRPPSSR